MSHAWSAVDLGAESGRVFVGRLEGGRVVLQEAHRFANRTARVEGTLRWDVQRLYGEILAGLGAAARAGRGLDSVAIDGWGVDFGLLDARGELLAPPFHSRDRQTDGIPDRLHARVPEPDLWAATGVQALQTNTLYQLFAMARRRSSTLLRAARLLFIPDLLAYWLCGVQAAEHTIASTSQCYDLAQRTWIVPLLARARIPAHLFPPVVPPATKLGPLRSAPARRAGLPGVQVVAPACHATASAVAAIPAEVPDHAYVSAGTSSLVGTTLAAPVRSERARRLGFTNEAGVDGTVCLHRSVAGLRLLQECRRAWAGAGGALDSASLAAQAAAGRPLRSIVDPDHPSLREPDDMPAAIRALCARTGQPAPDTRAELLRTILESLAWSYRRTLHDLEALLGRRLEVVHVVGGGARNALLCQLTADACGRPVLAGPAEAAALGNVLAQAIATGACASWSEARALARASCAPVRYEPADPAAWDEAAARVEPALERPHDDGDGATPAPSI